MSNPAPVPAVSTNPTPTQAKDNNAWHEFDILAAVVSRYQNAAPKKPQSPEHRISCHRCGNIRKRRILCTRSTCPHTFCGRCAEKMKEEHGLDVFFGGCPVCKELCCCNNKSVFCHRKNHCYRKCPATKTNGKNTACGATTGPAKEDSDSEPYPEEQLTTSIPKPENGQYGIFDLLAAVADMDKANPTLGKGASKNGSIPSNSGSNVPRKKPKTTKEGCVGGSGVSKHGFPNNMLLCEPSYTPYFSTSGSAETVSNNLQLLHNSKHSPNLTGTSQTLPASLSGDSGVDGFTFNNNTMGIIRGNINGVDALTLMGQQKHKYASMDQLGALTMPRDNLLSGITTTSAASTTSGTLTSAASSQGSSVNIYNRLLPSIDSNPFSTTATKDASRQTATFDQALLDSVRNIQADPYLAMGKPLPSLKTETATGTTADVKNNIHSSTSAATTGSQTHPAESLKQQQQLGSSSAGTSASSGRVGMSHAADAAFDPMNLLALVSSYSQNLGKELPSEHLFLSKSAVRSPDAADTKPVARGD